MLLLTQFELFLDGDVTIDGDVNGDDAPDITVDAQDDSTIFVAFRGTSTLNGLTLTNGSSGFGGAVVIGASPYSTAEVTIFNSVLSGNYAGYGGAAVVTPAGTLHLIDSTVSGNHADYGGGIYNLGGTVTVTNSTVSGNQAYYSGAGIYNFGGTLTVTNSTLSGNTADISGNGYGGGGLYNAGTATLINTTLSGNHGGYAGGGIANSGDLTLINTTLANNDAEAGGGLYNAACGCGATTLINSTVTGNYASDNGGGIANYNGTVTITNSIVAGNGAGADGPDVFSDPVATTNYAGVNVFSQAGAGDAEDIVETDLTNIFAAIDPLTGGGLLADNGGPVQTVAILPGGLAHNAGDTGELPADSEDLDGDTDTAEDLPFDARGLPRVFGANVDVGAFEQQNTVPVAQDGAASGNEDNPINGVAVASDVDTPSSVSYSLMGPNGGALHGTVMLSLVGTFTYTPAANFNGGDSFSFKANDGTIDSNTASITLTVAAVNDAPVAQNGSASGNEDTAINGTAVATDVDNTAAQLTYLLIGTNGGAAHGTVVINANGTFSYTPQANFNGADSFSFKANDGVLDSNAATITLTVAAVNDAPVAQNGLVSGNEDTVIGGTVSASDVDNTAAQVSYSLVGANGGATHGTVTLNPNGSFTYRPAANFNGSDSFSFRASDGTLASNIAVESLTVVPVNDPPVITGNQDDGFAPAGSPSHTTVSVPENTALVTIVAAADLDSPILSYSIVGGADQGRFQINAATGALSFSSAPDFEAPSDADHNNSYIVQVRASDGSLSADEIITVNVTDVNEAVTIARPVDFNGDSIDDLLWRLGDGGVALWTSTAGKILAPPLPVGSAPLSTIIEGTGDFNGDGRGDILFRSADDHIAEWLMNGNQLIGARDVGTTDATWHVSGTGDFNGDHTDDILFRSDAGQVATWTMQEGNIASIQIAGSAGPASHIQSTGDFNGDGRTDILFRNDDGHVVTWLMNNGRASAVIDIGSAPGSAHIAGTGDFNGDGQTDILFRGDDGHVTEWLMTSGHVITIRDIGSADASWSVLGTGDVNGDGRDDILWDNADGHVTAGWLLNNAGQIASIQDLGHTPTGTQIGGSHFDLV